MTDIDLFISHATRDDAIVSRIHAVLEAEGIAVWVDHEDGIGPGDQWPDQIQQAANTCKAGLFVMSVKSAQSPYCTAEWQRILDRGVRLYVVLIETVPVEIVPLRLGIVQYVDLRTGFDGGLAQLLTAINGERGLDAQNVFVGQVRRLTGTFPHAALDLPLIGREKELAQVKAALADGHRVTSILGLGGVGKTRLAAEIANTADFRDGVIWHTISPETSLMHLTGLIRDHLQLEKTSDDSTIWQTLGQRQALLVLDNAEDCREPAAYAGRLQQLDLSGGTRVLMTSRHHWPELRGKAFDLHVPDLDAAVEILRAMAKREPPAFPLDGSERLLAQAARQHPRIMEYAVRWLDSYPPDYVQEILNTLEGADAEQLLNDIVHKTLKRVRSREGGKEAINALRRLAVCRGGFTFDAARALIDSPRALATLKQWGLVSLEEGRYAIDPLVTKAAGVDERAHWPHFTYYIALTEEHDASQDYLGLDVESANLEDAFEWAMQRGQYESAYWLANACSKFFSNRGRFRQRANWMIRLQAILSDHAEDELRAVLQNSLGNAYLELAEVEERESNLQRAIAAYEGALVYSTPERAPLYALTQNNLGIAYRTLAEVEECEPNLRRAIAAYEAALQYHTSQSAPLDYAMIQNNLGNVYSDLAEVEERDTNLRRAIAAFEAALKYRTAQNTPLDYAMTQSNLGNVYSALAQVEERGPNLRRAIAAFEAALLYCTPRNAPLAYAMIQNNLGNALCLLAQVEEREPNLRRAIAALEGAMQYSTPQTVPLNYATIQNSLGSAYRDLAEVEESEPNLRRAITACDIALQIRPDYVNAYVNRGLAYRGLLSYEDALADFDRALELDPNSDGTVAERGETLRLLGHYDRALADFNRALELDPEYAWALASRGQTHHSLQHYVEALADFDRALELDPNLGWILAGRGNTLRLLGSYDQALTDFSRALELDPNDTRVLASRGHTYLTLQRYEEALADFDRARELDATSVWLLAIRGETLRQLGRYIQALADLDRALEMNPNFAWVASCRAKAHAILNRFEEAEADYSRAIEIESGAAYTLCNRAGFYLDCNRLQEAEADLAAAAEAEPDAPYLHYYRARLSALKGKPESALEHAKWAIEREKPLALAHIPAALAHLLLGDLESAAASIRTFVNEAKDPEDLITALRVVERFLVNCPRLNGGTTLLTQLRDGKAGITRTNP